MRSGTVLYFLRSGIKYFKWNIAAFNWYSLILSPTRKDLYLLSILPKMFLFALPNLILTWPTLRSVEFSTNQTIRILLILLSTLSLIFWVSFLCSNHQLRASRGAKVPSFYMVGLMSWVKIVKHSYGNYINLKDLQQNSTYRKEQKYNK